MPHEILLLLRGGSNIRGLLPSYVKALFPEICQRGMMNGTIRLSNFLHLLSLYHFSHHLKFGKMVTYITALRLNVKGSFTISEMWSAKAHILNQTERVKQIFFNLWILVTIIMMIIMMMIMINVIALTFTKCLPYMRCCLNFSL